MQFAVNLLVERDRPLNNVFMLYRNFPTYTREGKWKVHPDLRIHPVSEAVMTY